MNDVSDGPMERMGGAPPTGAPAQFGRVRLERGRFLLECSRGGRIDGRITAYVNGIPIGSSGETGSAVAGAEIEVACDRFPCVGMPCRVRFADGSGATDLALPFVMDSAVEAERLVGPGRLEQVRVAIRHGVISGHGINNVNGLARPMLLGRVNGESLREIRVSPPRPREEGGAELDFTLAIDAADLTESGAHYEILALPDMTVLAHLAFPRADEAALARAVAGNRAAIDSLSKRLSLETARTNELTERRHAEQRQTMEAVAEYLIALVHDSFAGRGPEPGARDETLKDFRKAVDEATRAMAAPAPSEHGSAVPASAFFADGWSWVEQDPKGYDFRWMGLGATVLNPQPHRPVSQVTVTIATTYRAMAPEMTAMLDGATAQVELVSSPKRTKYTMRVTPGAGSRLVQALRLVSAKAGRPSEDEGSEDERLLSVAVSGVVFQYED